jgi:hypothetical protein
MLEPFWTFAALITSLIAAPVAAHLFKEKNHFLGAIMLWMCIVLLVGALFTISYNSLSGRP